MKLKTILSRMEYLGVILCSSLNCNQQVNNISRKRIKCPSKNITYPIQRYSPKTFGIWISYSPIGIIKPTESALWKYEGQVTLRSVLFEIVSSNIYLWATVGTVTNREDGTNHSVKLRWFRARCTRNTSPPIRHTGPTRKWVQIVQTKDHEATTQSFRPELEIQVILYVFISLFLIYETFSNSFL